MAKAGLELTDKKKKNTPLHIACEKGFEEIIKVSAISCSSPPWRQPRGKWMVSLVNFHTNPARIGWHLWEIDLRFATGLPPGWWPVARLRSRRPLRGTFSLLTLDAWAAGTGGSWREHPGEEQVAEVGVGHLQE